MTKPLAGHFEKAGVTPRRHLVELRTDRRERLHARPGAHAPRCSRPAQLVDVTGTTKGKGTAGVMKRHGFHGVGASPRRAPQPPQARLDRRLRHPGPRVQGHADGRPDGSRHARPRQSLTVHAVDAERGLLLIKGAVPGPKGGLVLVRTAAKDRREGER